jgi:hypothetical protein
LARDPPAFAVPDLDGKVSSMNDSYWLFGSRLSVLAGRAETDGHYDLVEGWFPPGTQTPPHRHGA